MLKSINRYRPKLICIEYNPSIPNVVHFVQEPDPRIKHGSSARAIVDQGKLMGYSLVAATYCNLLLVENSFVTSVVDNLPDLEELNPNGNDPQFLFCGYDGTILSNKPTMELIWHGAFPLSAFQILPKYLRRFRGDYSFFQKLFFIFVYSFKNGFSLRVALSKLGAKLRD